MGVFGSKSQQKQILLTGPEGAGKTTLLYSMILRKKEWRATPTTGFNYEEIQSERGDRAGVWDVGGSLTTQMIMSSIYKNVHFSGLLYVINIDDPEHVNIARKELQRLLNEDELRHIQILGLALCFKTYGSMNAGSNSNKQLQMNNLQGQEGYNQNKVQDKREMTQDQRLKRKKQLHEDLDLESLNKKITIISEIFDVVQEKEERVQFIDNVLKSVNEQGR
eukprot:403340077